MFCIKQSKIVVLWCCTNVILIHACTKRPQYSEIKKMNKNEEVNFVNKAAGITLAGTLTIPQSDKPVPAVLLISGMGPNDRDYTMFSGHKLFAVLAEHLVHHGIAVLRYDKRGVGKSTGTFDTNLTSKDLAGDALAGIAYLKTRPEINVGQIGLIGHSEGGLIASMIAAQSPDIAFVILMAAAVATSIDNVVEHLALQLRADGASEQFVALDGVMHKQVLAIAVRETDHDKAAQQMHAVITQYLQTLPEAQRLESEKLLFAINKSNVDDSIAMFNSPWYRYYLTCDPVAVLKKIKVPVLVLNGTLDFIASSRIVLPLIEQALRAAENRDYTTLELPQLNHWLQTCKTGALAEYGSTKEAISPIALNAMSEWIVAHTANR